MAVAVAVPVVHLILRATEATDPMGQLFSSRILRLLSGTLRLAGAVTALTLVLGVGIAWLVERTDLPGRRVLGLAATVPLVVPTYVGALALLAAFGPRGVAFELPGLIGFWGATVSLTLSTFPYVVLMARAVLRSLDPTLEEAARALGDGRARVFRRVVIPQLRPAMGAGGLLVFLYVLSDFGAVSIMRYDTLTRGIFLEYRTSFDRVRPALIGLVLVSLTLGALMVERVLRGRPAPAQVEAGRRPPPVVRLGRWRWPSAAAVAAVAAAGTAIPVAILSYWAVTGSEGSESGSVLTRAASTSIELSALAASAAVLAALPIAFLGIRYRSRFSAVVEALAFSGFALPGLVIALAVVFVSARYLPGLYQTLALVVVAYVIRFLPEALGSLRSSLLQVDPALEEAGRSLGRGRLHVAATITLPLVRGGLLAGAALVFLTAMKELPATLLLLPAGYDTLATRVWTGASQGLYGQAAPAALLLIATSALVLWPLQRLGAPRRLGLGGSEVPAG